MENIINEWDTMYLPYVFYQNDKETYNKLEYVINRCYEKNIHVYNIDLLKLMKPIYRGLIKKYDKKIIQTHLKYLVHYINEDVMYLDNDLTNVRLR